MCSGRNEMRKWCLTLAIGGLLALPLYAQQKYAGSGNEDSGTAVPEKSTAASHAAGSGEVAPANYVFALPAAPRPAPVPGASDSAKGTRSPGMLAPRYELAGMYQYVNFVPGDPFANFNNHGSTVSFTYNPSSWLGLTAEFGSYAFKRVVSGSSQSGEFNSYLFGPRLSWRHFDHLIPFGEFLVGGAHGNPQLIGASGQSAFALAAGGGVDVALLRNLVWRFAQVDYLMTNFAGPAVGPTGRQNNFRAGTGVVFRWGFPAPPPPANRPPVAACSASPASVYAGSGDSVAVRVNASDPDNDPLTYSYSATGGTVLGTGPDARWSSTRVAVGAYTVNAKVDDGKGGTASCAADIKVEEKPNHPPTASLAVERSPILPGERTGVTCTGSDPDNDPLTYSYTATGGQIDGRGGTADAAGSVEVKEPPQIKQLEARLALHSIYFPTALPTVAKPNGGLLASQQKTLDTLASDYKQYLSYKPDAHLILEGHADIRGAKDYNAELSQRRVERTKGFLVEHGVPADHLETKAHGLEKNLSADEVKKLIEQDTDLSAADRQKILTNLQTVVLANNRRVDVTLTTTGEQSVRRFPFNAEDALSLISRKPGEAAKKPAAPAPKKGAKP